MRRRDREITEETEMRQVLDTAKVIRIGMNDGEGIYILPMNYGYTWENGELVFYMHCGMEGKKLEVLEENPKVGFELDCDHELVEGRVPCQYGFRYGSIIGQGMAEIVEEPQEKIKALTVLMKCQTDKDFTFNERLVSIVKVIKVTVSEFSGKRRE